MKKTNHLKDSDYQSSLKKKIDKVNISTFIKEMELVL